MDERRTQDFLDKTCGMRSNKLTLIFFVGTVDEITSGSNDTTKMMKGYLILHKI